MPGQRSTTAGLFTIALGLLICTALPSGARACGSTPVPAAIDRSWIRSDTTIYGVNRDDGLFRFRINSSGTIERLGHHDGGAVTALKIFPDKKRLYYRLSIGMFHYKHWIYDIATGQDVNLQTVVKDVDTMGMLDISPDFTRIAWVPPSGDGVRVVDMATYTSEFHQIITGQQELSEVMLFGITWSRDGRDILIGVRRGEAEQFWSLDAETGAQEKIEAQHTTGQQDAVLHYLRDGVEIGSSCTGCRMAHDTPMLELSDGVRAKLTGDSFVIERPGVPPAEFARATPRPTGLIKSGPDGSITFETEPMCIFPQKALLGQVDGRYIVYAHDDGIWLYGVEEGRSVWLFKDAGAVLVW
jgi:hypothetical protein